MRWQRIVLAVLITVALAAGIAACGGSSGSDGSDSGNADDKLSAETQAHLDMAMPKLEKIVAAFQNGNYDKAGSLWESIGDIPVNTTADNIVADDYLEYANNVRYWMIDDGSATLKDVETSKTKADATIASFQ